MEGISLAAHLSEYMATHVALREVGSWRYLIP